MAHIATSAQESLKASRRIMEASEERSHQTRTSTLPAEPHGCAKDEAHLQFLSYVTGLIAMNLPCSATNVLFTKNSDDEPESKHFSFFAKEPQVSDGDHSNPSTHYDLP